MKKLILALMVLPILASASMKWTCYRYVDGKPTGGFVPVYADTKDEAVKKALKKYKELGYKVDYVKCK